jgi:hypothetical protein
MTSISSSSSSSSSHSTIDIEERDILLQLHNIIQEETNRADERIPRDDVDIALELTKSELMIMWLRQKDGRLSRIMHTFGVGSLEAHQYTAEYHSDTELALTNPLEIIRRKTGPVTMEGVPHDENAAKAADNSDHSATTSAEHDKSRPALIATPMKAKECIACGTPETSLHRLHHVNGSCKHCFCEDCLSTCYKLALKDKSLVAVKCCTVTFDLTVADVSLKGKELDRFKHLYEELTTNFRNHIYCPDTACGSYVPLHLRSKDLTIASCPNCWRAFCLKCRKDVHQTNGSECLSSTKDDEKSVDLTPWTSICQTYGYKICPNTHCGVVVERIEGCRHMTCRRCYNQFCYTCGKIWRSCTCR